MALNNHKDRAHAVLSASSSSRWLECPPSAMVATKYPQADNAYTREGTLAHEVAEAVVRGASVNMSFYEKEGLTLEMFDHANAYRDYIQELIRDDSATVLLEQRLDFSPWVPDGFGTGDCIIIQGHRLDVIDYKYGQGVAVSAVNNSQMMFYGLGAWSDFGIIYDIQEIGLHIFQPRINNISTFELPVEDLLLWGETVKPRAQLAAKGSGSYKAGAHCRFCPHAGACVTLADSCLGEMEKHGGLDAVPSLTPEQVAEVLKTEPMITSWLKAVKDRALSSMLDGESVPGFKVVEGRGSRAWADDLEVAELLTTAGYKKEEYTKTELLSPAAMEKALGKKKVAELLSGQILSHPGSPTVVTESDRRKPFDRMAEIKKDFI